MKSDKGIDEKASRKRKRIEDTSDDASSELSKEYKYSSIQIKVPLQSKIPGVMAVINVDPRVGSFTPERLLDVDKLIEGIALVLEDSGITSTIADVSLSLAPPVGAGGSTSTPTDASGKGKEKVG